MKNDVYERRLYTPTRGMKLSEDTSAGVPL